MLVLEMLKRNVQKRTILLHLRIQREERQVLVAISELFLGQAAAEVLDELILVGALTACPGPVITEEAGHGSHQVSSADVLDKDRDLLIRHSPRGADLHAGDSF